LAKLNSEGKLSIVEISGLERISVYQPDMSTGQFNRVLLEKLIVAQLLKKLSPYLVHKIPV
jgi:hypothetical protein